MRGGGVAGVLGGKPAKVLAHRTQRRAWQRPVPKDRVAVLRCGVGEAGEDSRRRPVAGEGLAARARRRQRAGAAPGGSRPQSAGRADGSGLRPGRSLRAGIRVVDMRDRRNGGRFSESGTRGATAPCRMRVGRGASPGLTLVHIAGQAVGASGCTHVQCRGSAIVGMSRRAALRPRAPACTGRATWDARPAARGGGGRRAGGGGGRGAAADQRAWMARNSSRAGAPLQGFAPHPLRERKQCGRGG